MLSLTGIIFIVAWTGHLVIGQSIEKRSTSDMKLVCYYSNWAIYRPGLAKFTPENINPFLCTHIIYAFAGLSKDYELKPFDSYNDIQQGNYKKFVGLKTYNPKLKVLIAVGGWNEGSKRFSKLVESSTSRLKFVRSAVRFLRQHHFDGLDLDWEYPGFRDGASDNDRQGYAKLVQELREAFDEEESPRGKNKLLLAMAVPAGQQYIDKGFDIPSISRDVDFMSILSYDYHTAHEPQANHHAPLFRVEEDDRWDPNANLNVEWTVKHYLKMGAPPEKLMVGIPTYGRSYTLQDPDDNELEALTDGPGEKGPATREKGYLAYYEICQKIQDDDWDLEVPYPKAMGPYAFKDDQWVGFDDEDIIIVKAKFIIENGLGGAMVWTLDNDDFRGTCYGEQSPLITTLRTALLSNSIEGSSSERDDRRSRVQADEPPKEEVPPRGSARKQSSGLRRARVLTYDDEDVVSTTPRTRASLRTPAPPTTPDPGPPFECRDEGFFNNPRDCRKYFWCLDSGPSELGIVPHAFTCPSGLYFNSRRDSCDYPENVACRITTTTETPTTKAPSRRRLRPRTSTTTRRPTKTTPPPPTTTTTVATTERAAKQLSNDLANINGPLNKALSSSSQNILELLRLLDSVGGIDKLQEMLKGGRE